MDRNAILSIDNVSIMFGGLKALDGVTIDIRKGEVLCIIGPNGAGKTTLFNCITGFLRPSSGSIVYDGSVSLEGMKPHEIASYGIYRSFQNLALFTNISAADNVMIGALRRAQYSYGIADMFFRTKRYLTREAALRQEADDLLGFMGIARKKDRKAGELSYGERKLLELARGLITKPQLLLLDEPAAGLNPTEKTELVRAIKKIREQKVNVVIIEHDMRFVSDIADRIAVLDYGKKLAGGLPGEIKKNTAVIEAYLGTR